MAPESLVRYTRQAAASSMNSPKLVSPAKFLTGAAMFAAMLSHNSRSAFEPNRATGAPVARAMRFADSVNRSGSQRLAEPYAAPGLTPIAGPGQPNSRKRASPASRAAHAPSSRIALLGGRASIRP